MIRRSSYYLPIAPHVFEQELLPGEFIQWQGQPNPSVVFHREDWFLVAFALFFMAVPIVGLVTGPGEAALVFAPLLVMGPGSIGAVFAYKQWTKRRTHYALTNRRALIVRFGPFGRKVTSALLDGELGQMEKRVRRDGNGIISFGGPIVLLQSKGGPRPSPMFMDIDDCDAVYRRALEVLRRPPVDQK